MNYKIMFLILCLLIFTNFVFAFNPCTDMSVEQKVNNYFTGNKLGIPLCLGNIPINLFYIRPDINVKDSFLCEYTGIEDKFFCWRIR